MLRLERDELIHSPIVSSRQDALYDVVEELNIDSMPELPSICSDFLELDEAESQPPIDSGNHFTNDGVIHEHHCDSNFNLNCISFDESNVDRTETQEVEGDIDLMQDALLLLADATEDNSFSGPNRYSYRGRSNVVQSQCPKKRQDFSRFPNPCLSQSRRGYDEKVHGIASTQEEYTKRNMKNETPSEFCCLTVPQVTFDEDDTFDSNAFFEEEKPAYRLPKNNSVVPIVSHPSYNQPSQWLRQQVSSDAASLRKSWTEMIINDPPKTRKTNKVDVRASPATKHKHWSKEEDETLKFATESEPSKSLDWIQIARNYFNNTRSATQCKNRWKNYLKPGIVRGNWQKKEDEYIISMVARGDFKWVDIAKGLPGRTGEHVRERYVNVLDTNLKRTSWTKEEDRILFEKQRLLGNKWSEIRKHLPGRSDNSIKNRYHNRRNAYLRRVKREAQQNNVPNP